jgi:hypothetical protein
MTVALRVFDKRSPRFRFYISKAGLATTPIYTPFRVNGCHLSVQRVIPIGDFHHNATSSGLYVVKEQIDDSASASMERIDLVFGIEFEDGARNDQS